MKYINLLLLLFIIASLNQYVVYGLTDIEAAKSIYEEIYGSSPDYDPCSLTSLYFICDQDISGSKYVSGIYMEVYDLPSNDPITLTTDFSPFIKVNTTVVNDPIRLGDSFFNNIDKLVSLKTLSIQTQTSAISNSVVLPSLLSTISIINMGTKVSSSLFNGKTSITIKNPISGYSIDSTLSCTPQTTTKISLELPISNLGGLPNNIFNCLSINTLTLNVMNKKGSPINPSNQAFTLPSFPKDGTLYLNIVYNFEAINQNDAILFNFEPSLANLTLNTLVVKNIGFKLDKQLGYFVLPQTIGGLGVTFQKIGSSLFGECTSKPCVKSLSLARYNNIKLFINYADFYLDYIDFSGILGFGASYNTYQQSIPEDMNITSLDSFAFTYSNVYGDVPYVMAQIYSIDLTNNGINGSVPSPFICQGGKHNQYILVEGNNFTNFNLDTEPSCPNFYIEPLQDNLVFDTAGNDKLLIKGTDLGLEYSLYSNFMTSKKISPVLNEQLLYPIQGSGKSISVILYFQRSLPLSFSFSYSFAPPIIRGYKVFGSDLSFLGVGFNYQNSNSLRLNGKEIVSTMATQNCTSIPFVNGDFTDGQLMQLQINVSGLIGTANFTYEQYPIYMFNPKESKVPYEIFSSGGEFTLFMYESYLERVGSVGLENFSFYIGNYEATILSIQSNGLRIKYGPNDNYLSNVYDKPRFYLINKITGAYDDYTDIIYFLGQYTPGRDNDHIGFANSITINLFSLFCISILLLLIN